MVRLKRRARSFLEAAGLVDDPDLKAFFAEQAMQLHLKAVLLELFGERLGPTRPGAPRPSS